MERYQEKFEEWYNNSLFDEETKKELETIKNDENEKKKDSIKI